MTENRKPIAAFIVWLFVNNKIDVMNDDSICLQKSFDELFEEYKLDPDTINEILNNEEAKKILAGELHS